MKMSSGFWSVQVITVPQPAEQFLPLHQLHGHGDGISPLWSHFDFLGGRHKTVFHWEGMSWEEAACRQCATNVSLNKLLYARQNCKAI